MILKTEFPNHKKENDSGNKIMNNRISILEIRLNQMEKIEDFLYENFEKSRNPNFSEIQVGLWHYKTKTASP